MRFNGVRRPYPCQRIDLHNAEGQRTQPGSLRRAADRGAQYQARLEWCNDARTGMPLGIPRGAMCVQRFDDSLNSAIHITYRISLRSSSMPEPRDPLLKVLTYSVVTQTHGCRVVWSTGGPDAREGRVAPEATESEFKGLEVGPEALTR